MCFVCRKYASRFLRFQSSLFSLSKGFLTSCKEPRRTRLLGMSREKINDHHRGGASRVSLGLPEAGDLAAMFPLCLTVDREVSDESMYLVSGVLS